MKILLCETSQGSLNKNIGTEIAPKKIIEELNNYTFNEDHKKITFQTEKTTISQNISETHRNIFNKILEEEPEIILGGDHSITYSSVKAFSKRFLNPSLIILDAHPDLETSDLKEPTHEDYLRRLIEKNIRSGNKRNNRFYHRKSISVKKYLFIYRHRCTRSCIRTWNRLHRTWWTNNKRINLFVTKNK